MELKRVEPLADSLSGLIRQAVRDVQRIEKTPGYELGMDVWHSGDRLGTCYVCMAGAVMACTLGAPKESTSTSIFTVVEEQERRKLYAINEIRTGNVNEELCESLGLDVPIGGVAAMLEVRKMICGAFDVFDGHGHAPWNVYEEAADALEAAGL